MLDRLSTGILSSKPIRNNLVSGLKAATISKRSRYATIETIYISKGGLKKWRGLPRTTTYQTGSSAQAAFHGNNITQNGPIVNQSSSDADYMSAVTSGYTDAAERMVQGNRSPEDLYRNTVGEIEAEVAARTGENQQAPIPYGQNAVAVEDYAGETETVVSYYDKDQTDDDGYIEHTKDQIRASYDIIEDNGVVFDEIIDEEVMRYSKNEMKNWVLDRFKASGGFKVDRKGFGIIGLTAQEVNTAMDYAKTPGEKLALAAIQKVLKRGVEIHAHEKHKNHKDVKSVTIGGKVVINGVPGHMGVAVKKEGRYHYHAHRILTPQGAAFIIETKKRSIFPGEYHC